VSFPEVVRANVVSNDVTITSSLRIYDNIRNKFSIFLVKWVLRMVRARKYEIASTFVKVIQRKLLASFFPDTVYYTFYNYTEWSKKSDTPVLILR